MTGLLETELAGEKSAEGNYLGIHLNSANKV